MPSSIPGKVRVGAVSYLNSKPLIEGLAGADGLELYLDYPSRLAERLARGELDVALIPSIESLASVSNTRACGAITTSPSMPWAARCARPSAIDAASDDSMFAVLTQYPAVRAADSMAAMLDAGPYWVLRAARMPIVCEREVTSARAARFGRYCRRAMTSSTRSLVSGRMLG